MVIYPGSVLIFRVELFTNPTLLKFDLTLLVSIIRQNGEYNRKNQGVSFKRGQEQANAYVNRIEEEMRKTQSAYAQTREFMC
jgi:hypothetical protein